MKSIFSLAFAILTLSVQHVFSYGHSHSRRLASCPAGSIMDGTGKYCCPGTCGACGGYGCGERPGGASSCCTSQITQTCGNPPCIAAATTAEAGACPVGGIANDAGTVCCPGACGKCGGYGCDVRPGGAASCCTGGVTQTCSASGYMPCLVGGGGGYVAPVVTAPAPAPAPVPVPASTGGLTCTQGVPCGRSSPGTFTKAELPNTECCTKTCKYVTHSFGWYTVCI